MPLFPQEEGPQSDKPDAAQRMFWTREGGTRRLVVGFVAVILIWFVFDRVRDHYLLAASWKPLTPDVSGLTVVGTLDARGNYDRNMFKVVQASKEFRVELTDFGWRSIFDSRNGAMFSEANASAIKRACDLDGQTGNAMLEPYLRAGVAQLMGRANWKDEVSPKLPIVVEGAKPGETVQKGTLGELIAQYSRGGSANKEEADNSDTGNATGATQDVEHGMAVPGDVLAHSCPIVLTGAQFNSAYLEEHPATLVGGKTWTLHLGLTSEGRSRFYQWSHDHANENLIFILNHEVLAAGRIAGTLDVNEWGIGPLHDEQSAKQLEAYVNRNSRGK